MDDGLFEAGEKLNLDNSPDFQKELVFSSKPNADSWQFLNELTEKQVGARPGMLGHHAIAARVGSTLGGGVIALLTAYRKPEDRKFFESDARNLHHAAVLLRLALATQRTNERLEALTDAIGTVLRASSTAQITASLCDFLHTQIQESLEFRGHKTKTTARLFLRGTGMLARWGEAERSKIGLLEEHGVKPISVNEDCVYSRAIISKQTKTSLDPEECDKKFKPTTRIKIHSYINVPLVYDGAAIGAINLETGLKDAYKQADVSIVEAVAGAAAAAVLNHRSQRFMTQLAQLTSLAVNPAASEPSDPDALLNRGAKILYELCGFSDFLLFEAQEVSDDPWQIVKAWEGDDCGNKINRRPLDTLEGMNHHISTRWQETFLKSCLDAKTNEVIFVSHGNQLGVTDDGDGLLRPRGRPTLSHVVVLFGEPDAQKTRALMLLFEHPSPIPGHFVQVFSDYSTFLNTIYSTTFAEIHNYGEALTAARIEARAGRVYSQVRHSIASQLASIYNAVDLGRRAKDADSDILDEVVERVRTAQEDFDKSRVLLKSPEYDTCDLVGLWRAVVEDMQPRIKAAGLRVETRSEEIEAYTDPKLASYVLFNLLDNALIHGKENGATLIWFEGLPDGKEGCAVCDNGNEIDPDLVRRIFNMGATTKSQGGGQGLFLSQGIANDLKGDLVLIRRDDANCFELRL
ncbi:MAG: GAF domain-containing sensor histidine kinase [Pseudomonadota bacterium]